MAPIRKTNSHYPQLFIFVLEVEGIRQEDRFVEKGLREDNRIGKHLT